MRRIAELYAIEEGIRGQSAQQRRLVRSREARPLVMAMKPWFEQELGRVPPSQHASGSDPLCSSDAMVPRFAASLMTVASSSTIIPLSVPFGRSRSAARTISSPDPTAVVAAGRGGRPCSSLRPKLNGIEPYAYLSDVLDRMNKGHPASRLDELLPWNWRAPADATPI